MQMKVTEAGFPEVYEKYKNTVYSVAFSYVKNVEDAADLLQETFLKLLSGDVEYESEEHMKAWLLRVAINSCKNLLRSRNCRANVPLWEEIPAQQHEESNELFRIVLTLPEKYRVPLHLFYYEDYSVRQIASVMDIPEATVRIRLKRGREKLGKCLRKEDWF